MILLVKIWKDGRGFHRASCDDLPGCRAVGMTQEEVRGKMHAAVHGYVASLHAVGPVELEYELVGNPVTGGVDRSSPSVAANRGARGDVCSARKD